MADNFDFEDLCVGDRVVTLASRKKIPSGTKGWLVKDSTGGLCPLKVYFDDGKCYFYSNGELARCQDVTGAKNDDKNHVKIGHGDEEEDDEDTLLPEACYYDEVKLQRASHRVKNLRKKRCAFQRTQEQRTESKRPSAQDYHHAAKQCNPHRHHAARTATRTTLSQDLLASNSPAMADIVGLALAQERSQNYIRKISFVHADSPRKIGIDLLEATTTDDSDSNSEVPDSEESPIYMDVVAEGQAPPQPPIPNLPTGSERISAAVDGVSRMVAMVLTAAVDDYVAEAKGYLTVRCGDCVEVLRASAESGDEGCRFSSYVFARHLGHSGLCGWLPVEVVWEQYVDPRPGKLCLYDCATGNWQWEDLLAKEPKDHSKGAMEVHEAEREGAAAGVVIRRQLRRWNGYNQVLHCQ